MVKYRRLAVCRVSSRIAGWRWKDIARWGIKKILSGTGNNLPEFTQLLFDRFGPECHHGLAFLRAPLVRTTPPRMLEHNLYRSLFAVTSGPISPWQESGQQRQTSNIK